ncbi:MAG: hypothetical protein IPJ32_07780 [Sphingobacteriaceae bacterium]|nr:hypothetical protein [Sphingobacteriaceae bacterium]
MVFTTANWHFGVRLFCARQISNGNYKKLFVVLSVVTNIGVLFAFKYFVPLANYFIDEFNRAECDYDSSYLLTTIIIPAGLSFYTFQSLSYTIDVYRGKYKAADKFYEFLLYVSFFPHMVAGPIVRYADLMPQFKIVQFFKNIDWESFAKLTIWGYFKRLLLPII